MTYLAHTRPQIHMRRFSPCALPPPVGRYLLIRRSPHASYDALPRIFVHFEPTSRVTEHHASGARFRWRTPRQSLRLTGLEQDALLKLLPLVPQRRLVCQEPSPPAPYSVSQ